MRLSSLVSPDAPRPEFLWRNGALTPWAEAVVHVNAVGHASVSSVFEGLKAYWNPEAEQLYAFRLGEHLQRLQYSLKVVRLRTRFSLADLVQGVLDLLRANQSRGDTYIRPWAFIEGVVYEQIAPADSPAEVIIDTWPFQSRMLTERGCRACISSWTRIGDNVLPPRVKAFSNYHNSRLATMEAKANGYDWPILLNDHHKVTEGPGSCVALIRDGKLITPDLASGVLESITRATLLSVAPEALSLPVIERPVDRTELYGADEAFFMGTGWEILPILEVDGLPVGDGKMGPVTRALDRLYHDLVRGIDPRFPSMRTPVY